MSTSPLLDIKALHVRMGEQSILNGLDLHVPLGGIVIGIMSAMLWQRFYKTKLPDYIGFFSGRRLVPILTASGAIVVGVLMSFAYPLFNWALTGLGTWVAEHSVVGGGVFGTVNRLLLPLGLHHIINSLAWFVFGNFTPPAGVDVIGE